MKYSRASRCTGNRRRGRPARVEVFEAKVCEIIWEERKHGRRERRKGRKETIQAGKTQQR